MYECIEALALPRSGRFLLQHGLSWSMQYRRYGYIPSNVTRFIRLTHADVSDSYQPPLPSGKHGQFIGTSSYTYPWKFLLLPTAATLAQGRVRYDMIASSTRLMCAIFCSSTASCGSMFLGFRSIEQVLRKQQSEPAQG
jgi:hypothetical protein